MGWVGWLFVFRGSEILEASSIGGINDERANTLRFSLNEEIPSICEVRLGTCCALDRFLLVKSCVSSCSLNCFSFKSANNLVPGIQQIALFGISLSWCEAQTVGPISIAKIAKLLIVKSIYVLQYKWKDIPNHTGHYDFEELHRGLFSTGQLHLFTYSLIREVQRDPVGRPLVCALLFLIPSPQEPHLVCFLSSSFLEQSHLQSIFGRFSLQTLKDSPSPRGNSLS